MSNAVLCQMVQNTVYLRKQLELLEKKDITLTVESGETANIDSKHSHCEDQYQSGQSYHNENQANKQGSSLSYKQDIEPKNQQFKKPPAHLGGQHVIGEANKPSMPALSFLYHNKIPRKPHNFKPKGTFVKGRRPYEPHGVSHMFPKRKKKR